MPTIFSNPTNKSKSKGKPFFVKPKAIPPSVSISPKGESLDRRIRNIEAMGNGVFLGNVLASYLALPGLVGFWPMSSVQRSTGNAYDLSGQGRTLTYNGNPVYTYYNGLVPYIDLDGTGDFLSRADETDLDILGTETIYTVGGSRGLTLGGWFWLDTSGTNRLMTKGTTTGNLRAYSINIGGGSAALTVSSTGADTFATNGAAISTEVWYFVAGRYTPSAELKLWLNSTTDIFTTSIPATLFNSSGGLAIGAQSDGTQLLDGRAALCFLCANALGDDLISSLFEASRILFGI